MRIGLVTSWNAECGIALYARKLVEHSNGKYRTTVLANREKSVPNAPDIIQCWNYRALGFKDSLLLIKNGIKQDLLHWQFEYLLFGLTGLAYFLFVLLTLRFVGRRQVVTLHSVVDRGALTRELITLSGFRIPIFALKSLFFIFNFILGRLAYIIVHTQYAGRVLSQQYLIPLSRIHTIPHGIEHESGEGKKEDYLLFHGFIKPSKGLHFLLRAFPKIQEIIPQARLVVAGKVLDEKYFRNVAALSKTDHVTFRRGFIEEEELKKLFEGSNVVVVPYRGLIFGSSGVVARALSYCKPLVYSPEPIFRDELKELTSAGFALCVDPTKPDELAEAVGKLWHNEIDANRYRALVSGRSWDNVAARTLELYGRVLA